ncbi:MAG TPA: oxygenase MpaB family protein [Chloroflexota bacterium]|nr:oxygenase MpaB family protein [Chloroflexota bacterium]
MSETGGLAGPESIAWRINREIVLLLGWGRAVLLQLAHPLVAAGVADHSVFVREPALRRRRLLQTVDAMLALTFGTREEVEGAARGINTIHDHVHGELSEETGTFARGTRYSAHDPELLRWVHATLMDSFPLTHRLFVGDLSDQEVERYLREAAGLEPLLGIPAGSLPRTRAGLDAYLTHMTQSGAIRVGADARRIARDLLNPALPWQMGRLLWPVLWLSRLPTIGLLPPEIREQYGFRWTRGHALALRALSAVARCIVPRTPGVLRHWPIARRAAARASGDRGATPAAAPT